MASMYAPSLLHPSSIPCVRREATLTRKLPACTERTVMEIALLRRLVGTVCVVSPAPGCQERVYEQVYEAWHPYFVHVRRVRGEIATFAGIGGGKRQWHALQPRVSSRHSEDPRR